MVANTLIITAQNARISAKDVSALRLLAPRLFEQCRVLVAIVFDQTKAELIRVARANEHLQ